MIRKKNVLCAKCSQTSVTKCDHCSKPTCRECSQIVVAKPTDEFVYVYHREGKCVPRKFRKDD